MTALQIFTTRIIGFDELARRPSALVPYFAYFLDEESPGAVITPKVLVTMFEELRLRAPVNPSDALGKCKLLVKIRSGGYRLSHHGQIEVTATLVPGPTDPNHDAKDPDADVTKLNVKGGAPIATTCGSSPSKKNVFVVYGRDERLRRDLFSFLRALDLNPLEFEEMAHLTGNASPFTLEVIETGFDNAQACVVLLSPDEAVNLRKPLRSDGDTDVQEFQPRQNVLIEAGMAIALQPKRTVFVRVGKVREISDLAGKNYVNLTNSAESRNKFLSRLQVAGCEPKSNRSDWLTEGNFSPTEENGK
jgi:predicted nucleotide-binding protein